MTIAVLSLTACAVEPMPPVEEAAAELQRTPVMEITGGTYETMKVVMDPEYEEALTAEPVSYAAQEAPTILFMNRRGGTYTPGRNDATQNISSLVRQTTTVAGTSMSDGDWQIVMSCIRDQFARFNVDITDVDPGAVPHFESVVAGRPESVGFPSNVAGVSPFTSRCDLIPNSIVFTFADVIRSPRSVCEVAAQEIAHSFGLDHQYLCEDPMTYLRGCGEKSFQDVYSDCGENSPRPCRKSGQFDCGYDQQNSVAILTERLGLRNAETPEDPPGEEEPEVTATLSIASPADGAQVLPGFTVSVQATNVNTVEFSVDGVSVASLTTPPFQFKAPSDLAQNSNHVIEVLGDNALSDSITVFLASEDAGEEPDGTDPGGEDTVGSDSDPAVVPPENPNAPTEESDPVVGGCSIGAGGHKGAGWLLLLCLLALEARRKRSPGRHQPRPAIRR